MDSKQDAEWDSLDPGRFRQRNCHLAGLLQNLKHGQVDSTAPASLRPPPITPAPRSPKRHRETTLPRRPSNNPENDEDPIVAEPTLLGDGSETDLQVSVSRSRKKKQRVGSVGTRKSMRKSGSLESLQSSASAPAATGSVAGPSTAPQLSAMPRQGQCPPPDLDRDIKLQDPATKEWDKPVYGDMQQLGAQRFGWVKRWFGYFRQKDPSESHFRPWWEKGGQMKSKCMACKLVTRRDAEFGGSERMFACKGCVKNRRPCLRMVLRRDGENSHREVRILPRDEAHPFDYWNDAPDET